MLNLQALSQQAGQIHDWFQGIFYALVTALLILSIFLEYFKWPMGGVPSFGPLVGRVLVAVILLISYPEVHNLMADLSDGLSQQLGNLNQFQTALNVMGDKVHTLSWSWTSVKQSIIVLLCMLSFFILYFSVHVAHAIYLYSILILYVFSPVLIALFTIPRTAAATSALYRSLIEASLWKPVWCVLATLLWSTGVSDIQAAGSQVSLLTAVCFCLIAAGSLVLTPFVVHALAGGGITSMARSVGSIGIEGIGMFTPLSTGAFAARLAGKSFNTSAKITQAVTKRPFPTVSRAIQRVPQFNVRPPRRVFKASPKNSKGEK